MLMFPKTLPAGTYPVTVSVSTEYGTPLEASKDINSIACFDSIDISSPAHLNGNLTLPVNEDVILTTTIYPSNGMNYLCLLLLFFV